jgi:alpha-L-arabinofuranosidase
MDEAKAWVEYCNGTGNTSSANLRRAHGRAEPYRVIYWGLGNEMYGSWQIGNMNAHDYVKKARAFAMVMKRTDPTIQLVGCGLNGWSEWDEIVLGGLAELVDFHSIHLYTGASDHYTTVFSRIRRSGPSGSARPHRARAPAPATRAPDRHRIRRVERLVPHPKPPGPRCRRRRAIQPL